MQEQGGIEKALQQLENEKQIVSSDQSDYCEAHIAHEAPSPPCRVASLAQVSHLHLTT